MKENPYKGKCYEITSTLMEYPTSPLLDKIIQEIQLNPFIPDEHILLCHGDAVLTNGNRDGHAWIEIVRQIIFDPATDPETPYEINNYISGYKCDKIRKFTRYETLALLHYGKFSYPWNKLTDEEVKEATDYYRGEL